MSSIFASRDEEGKNKNHHASKAETIIGPSVKIEGTFKGEGNVVVEGQVVGTLLTSSDLTVGQNARIEANVSADNMFISGEVRGNLQAKGRVELAASAKIVGDIQTNIISVAPGAVLKGKCLSGAGEGENGESERTAELTASTQSVAFAVTDQFFTGERGKKKR